MNPSTLAILVLLILMVGAVFLLERTRFTTAQLALIALMAGFIGLTRVPLAVLPGIQIATTLIICSGIAFGARTGMFIGLLTPAISNMLLGQGPWTLWQMLAWGLCGWMSGAAFVKPLARWSWALGLYGFAWGFAFGWINNTWIWLTTIQDLNLSTFIATCIFSSGLLDLAHALNNLILIGLLSPAILQVMRSYQKRLRSPTPQA
jgi:energy-coupling factor transport system substrate-specific component